MNLQNRPDNNTTFSSFLYRFVFLILKITFHFTNKKVSIWYRNSLVQRTVTFPFSDIDLTILVNDKRDVAKPLCLLKTMRRFIPILGEVNVFDLNDFQYIIPCLNYYELKRDQKLYSLTVAHHPHHDKYDAQAFLIRMIIADAVNLKKRPAIRYKKWKNHLNEVSHHIKILPQALQESDIRENLSHMITGLSFNQFLSLLKVARTQHSLLGHPRLDKNFIKVLTLFPVDALSWCVFFEDVDFYVCTLKSLDHDSLSLTLSQLKWELCGAYTQIHVVDDKEQVVNHAENILYVLNMLKIYQYDSLVNLILHAAHTKPYC